MGWFKTVSDAIYYGLCAAFNLNPASEDAMKRFVPAYIENATNAQAPRDMDICYFAVSTAMDEGLNYIQTQNVIVKGVPKVQIKKTVPVSVLFTFYGPNADDDAEFFWERVQWDSGAGSARAIWRKSNIAPIGKPDRPVTLFEVEGTYHRRRSDVRMNLAYLAVTESEAGYVDSAPEFMIETNQNN